MNIMSRSRNGSPVVVLLFAVVVLQCAVVLLLLAVVLLLFAVVVMMIGLRLLLLLFASRVVGCRRHPLLLSLPRIRLPGVGL